MKMLKSKEKHFLLNRYVAVIIFNAYIEKRDATVRSKD